MKNVDEIRNEDLSRLNWLGKEDFEQAQEEEQSSMSGLVLMIVALAIICGLVIVALRMPGLES